MALIPIKVEIDVPGLATSSAVSETVYQKVPGVGWTVLASNAYTDKSDFDSTIETDLDTDAPTNDAGV